MSVRPRALAKEVLRAMHGRWSRDLKRFARSYPGISWEADSPEIEVQRNLATAIVQIEFMLNAVPQPRNDGDA